MRNKMQHFIKLLIVLCCVTTPAVAKEFAASGEFYLQYFGGRVDPATLPRVYNVFNAVRNVADKHAKRWPELLVIRQLPGYQALALPDGHIILSADAIKLIYRGVTTQQGDTRLAFMLGHELAHLAEDDFWDAEVARALVGIPQSEQLKTILGLGKQNHAQTRKETQADDKGLLYAALAGYPVGLLFTETQAHSDFLSNWVQMTAASVDGEHALPAVRAQLLQQRLKQRVDRVEQFQFAVRLAHFGRCADALQLLNDLQTLFPGRALFNNIGYCHLQQGLASMPADIASLYWLPELLDPQSRLSSLLAATGSQVLRGRQLNPLSNHHLDQASKALTTATESDPHYAPAWINLASVQFLRGKIYQARAAIETARKLNSDNIDVQSLRLLILHEEGMELDISVKVIALLENLLQKHPEHSMTRYNLARLLAQRGRHAKAKQHWQRLAATQQLPLPIRRTVCQQLKLPLNCQQTPTTHKNFHWKLPIPIGSDLLNDQQVQKSLSNLPKQIFQFKGMVDGQNAIYSNEKFAVLSFDHIVEMLVLKRTAQESSSDLRRQAGAPNWIKQLAHGEIWNYQNWAAWIQNNQLKEIWISSE